MDKTELKSFFQRFRDLARTSERRIEKCKQDVDNPRQQDFCAPAVLKKIDDLKEETKSLNKELDKKISLLETENVKAAAVSCLARTINGTLSAFLDQEEAYLTEYGYVPLSIPEEENVEETLEEETEAVLATTPEPKPALKRDLNRTPQMEDFGISAGTIQMMNSVVKNPPELRQEVPSSRLGKVPVTIPPMFEHNGLICTPSLCSNMDRSLLDPHAALASPVQIQPPAPFVPEPRLPHQPKAKLDFNSEPKSPGLPKSSQPGIQFGAFTQTAGNLFTKMESTFQDFGEMPEEPELTYSLEALKEMTGMFQINCKVDQEQSQPPEPAKLNNLSAFTCSTTDTSKPLPPDPVLMMSHCHDNKENATPPEPLLQASARVTVSQESSKQTGFRQKTIQELLAQEMPPSPKLSNF